MVRKVTLSELKQSRESNPGLVLVEALPESYYRKHHIPCAINIPPGEVDELAPELLPDKDAEIVVYCFDADCRSSEVAGERLQELGYTNVADYHAGKQEWIDAGLPMERTIRFGSPPRTRKTVAPVAALGEAA